MANTWLIVGIAIAIILFIILLIVLIVVLTKKKPISTVPAVPLQYSPVPVAAVANGTNGVPLQMSQLTPRAAYSPTPFSPVPYAYVQQ